MLSMYLVNEVVDSYFCSLCSMLQNLYYNGCACCWWIGMKQMRQKLQKV